MDGLKQRVIGALVLVSLAVIFVPMLFDEPHTERSSKRIEIPEEPAFPAVDTQPPGSDDAQPSTAYHIEEPDQSASPDQSMGTPEQAAPTQTTSAESPQPASEPSQPVSSSAGNTASEPAGSPQSSGSTSDSAAESSESLSGAWLVQLGSFGNPDNAVRLRDNVRAKGYDSYIQKVVRGDTTLTRVFSGPFAEKAEAERAKKRLDAEFGVNGLVTSGDQ